jgi:hypothetical protein
MDLNLLVITLEMSLLSVRTRIMATMKDRNTTIRIELMMLNQCTCWGRDRGIEGGLEGEKRCEE